jgi:outer membrane protein OmpA-like peptidoglycan-associated protein
MQIITPWEWGNGMPLKWKDKSSPSANLGVLNSFRLGKKVDLILDARVAAVDDRIKGQYGQFWLDLPVSASVGLVVHLGKRDWAPATAAGMCDEEIAAMNAVISDMNRENADLRKNLNNAQSRTERIKETEWKNIASDIFVRFDINKTILLREARVQLGFLARMLKEYPEAAYTITGYADASTGTSEGNMQLSRGRAEVIKACLVREFGIEEHRLKTVYAGGIENRYYNDPYLSRAAIIRPDFK